MLRAPDRLGTYGGIHAADVINVGMLASLMTNMPLRGLIGLN